VAKRPCSRDLIFLPGQLLAVAVPFLRFTGPFVPVRILVGEPNYNWPAVPLLLIAPAILGPAMAASTVRQAVRGPLSRAERISAYALAFAVLMGVASASVDRILGPVVGPTVLLAALGAIAILAATRKGGLPAHFHAHIALLTAWIVNMGFAVIVTFAESRRLGSGWWVGAVSVLAVTVEAVVRVRRGLRSEGEAGAGVP
jgi:hypothetical protein